MIHDVSIHFSEVAPAGMEAAAYQLIRYIVAALTNTIADSSHCYLGFGQA